jgi:hypothetical protein
MVRFEGFICMKYIVDYQTESEILLIKKVLRTMISTIADNSPPHKNIKNEELRKLFFIIPKVL